MKDFTSSVTAKERPLSMKRGNGTISLIRTASCLSDIHSYVCHPSFSGQNGILSTIADPTNFNDCQPIRSAGRKKTHPVWLFFRDFRDISESASSMRFYWLTSDGIGHVSCLHCSFTSNDRSPNNLRAHLKRSHEADGQYQLFMAALAQVKSATYTKLIKSFGGALRMD